MSSQPTNTTKDSPLYAPFVQLSDALAKTKISAYEVSISSSTGSTTAVCMGEVESLTRHQDQSLHLVVYKDTKKGSASTTSFDAKSLEDTVASAVAIATHIEADPFNGLPPKDLLAFDSPDLDLYYPWDFSPKEGISLAMQCEQAGLASAQVVNSNGAEVSSVASMSLYANSLGLRAVHTQTEHSIFCSLVAEAGGEMQTAYDYSLAIDAKDLVHVEQVGLEAARLSREKLGSRTIASQKCPVIFTPRLATGLIAHLLGALAGSAQYRQTSFLLDAQGKQVLGNFLSVSEEPLSSKTIGARAFDSDGVAKKSQFFVQEGVVKSYIMGQYSANQMKLKTTANAGGVNNVRVGSNYDGNMIDLVKTMHKGLIINDLMGHGINPTTGDYSRGASGFWVDNGVIAYPVSGITIAGNLKTMLANIHYISKDFDARENIKVGAIMIDEMTIAGS